MKTFLEQIQKSVSIDKEMIEILPKKGIKKQRELMQKINETQDKYNKLKNSLFKEINIRYNNLTGIKENPEIKETYDKLVNLSKAETINSQKKSFEKMQLDRLVYDINGYYKKDLSATNKDIYECIQKFRKVGINVTAEDFCLSEYAQEYIAVLLEESKEGKLSSSKLRKKFDEVYWKCSDLIYHILVCIRYIYDMHEEEIDKYYEQKSKTIAEKTNRDLKEQKIKLDEKYNDLVFRDEKNILDNFVNGVYSIGDFNKSSYDSFYMKILGKNKNELGETEAKETDENIKRLNQNLVEYFKYLQYKFLSDETLSIKDSIAKEKEQEKSAQTEDKKGKKGKKNKTKFESVVDEIKEKTNEILKLNDKINNKPTAKSGLFNKKAEIDNKEKKTTSVERDKKILELKDLYRKFDDAKFEETIMADLDETSTMYDILKIATYYYGFLARCLIKQNQEITPQEITDKIIEIKDFIENYNFSVINNINMNEQKAISVIIKDKFKLIGFNLSKDDVGEASLEDTIRQTKNVIIANYINQTNISLEDIDFILKAKNIVNK